MARRYVRVCVDGYGQTARVVLMRWPWQRFYQRGHLVATLDLHHDDAEQQLADARAKARSLARGIAELEGQR